MDGSSDFVVNFFKALPAVGFFGVVLAVISVIITYIFDSKHIREENSHLSTGIGNALMVLHTLLEPGRKPQTEQVIKVKRRRTLVEKHVRGLTELEYDHVSIRGYSLLKSKRFFKKIGNESN